MADNENPIWKINGAAEGQTVQGDVFNPIDGDGQVAGVRFHTASGWNVMLRTRQDQAWLELTSGNGTPQQFWSGKNYTTEGLVTAGTLTLTGIQVLTGTDMTVDANGNVGKQSSSVRYKEDIQPLKDDFAKVLALQTVSFRYKGSDQHGIGYLAEDVQDAGLDNLLVFDTEGRPDAVQYKQLGIYALEILKQQEAALDAQSERITQLEALVEKLAS